MGGKALNLQGFGSRRISTPELENISLEVQELTKHLFLWNQLVKFYHTKPDHGDIDFVAALRPETPSNWMDLCASALKSQAIHKNPPVGSFEYQGVQIDIVGEKDGGAAKTYLDFCHYSPTGNIVQQLIKQTGAKWGVHGLTYPVRPTLTKEGSLLGTVHLSSLMPEILELAGLPFEPWHKGFESPEDIFSWAVQSPLFNKKIFDSDNSNHANRRRDLLRPNYHAWGEFIIDKPDRYPFYDSAEKKAEAKAEWFPILCARFPNLQKDREALLQSAKTREDHRKKLNGNLITSWTGIQGIPLGKIIGDFKNSLGEDFDSWLAKTSAEEAKEKFLSFHRNIEPERE